MAHCNALKHPVPSACILCMIKEIIAGHPAGESESDFPASCPTSGFTSKWIGLVVIGTFTRGRSLNRSQSTDSYRAKNSECFVLYTRPIVILTLWDQLSTGPARR